MIVFDIETGPLPDDVLLERVPPFEPPPHPGEFDPSEVKLGNVKDEYKIREKIGAARVAHEIAVRRHNETVEEAQKSWWAEVVSRAPLSPLTGCVLAIGYLSTDSKNTVLDIDSETEMLGRFWGQYKKCRSTGRKMCGHNILGFDVPFLMRRAWLLSHDVPNGLFDKGRWLDASTFVDTLQLWGCGTRDMIKLDLLARAFAVGAKPDGVDGSMFHELLKTDPEQARQYLTNDLQITAAVAERMGVL